MTNSRILVLGSGGREHALAWALAKSASVECIYVAPGNGGTNTSGKTVNLDINPCDHTSLIEFARTHNIDLVVVGPEQPLVDGIADKFKKAGIACFGPSGLASRIEGSKAFSKEFMKNHGIPTASFHTFTDYNTAKLHVQAVDPLTIVIKASGLAAGKGVILPETKEEALIAIREIMVDNIFGQAGQQVVIEERLVGEEVSILAFSDGYTVVPMPSAQDHKRMFNGDKGPNTGGMGAYAPAPIYTSDLQELVQRTILIPSISGMRRDGYPFIGLFYVGIILTPTGPKVLEYNCRFGDPETQVLLPLLDTDLDKIMIACVEGRLDSLAIRFKPAYAATVVLASSGYPGSYINGAKIAIQSSHSNDGTFIFHAGTTLIDGLLVANGGRILSVTGIASTLELALEKAYKGISRISFERQVFRTDIGHRATALLNNQNKTKGSTYADAGVSIDHGNLLVEQIKPIVKATRRIGADADLGGFGGVFDLKACGFHDPVLISGTDGVGTKLKIAHAIGRHDTIGIDLVAMSVNDVLVQGAEPLYFLDYFACSKLEINVAKDVVIGIARGCIESACALIGGETAEMPGLYQTGDYDLAGFVVGAVERDNILPKLDQINSGDVVLGIASSGVHSNGFSLVRHVIAKAGLDFHSPCPFEDGKTLGEALLTPTRIYVRQMLPAIKTGKIKSMAHITGGGFLDNIPRALNANHGVVINAGSWPLLPVFKWLKKTGAITSHELSRTFNCGIGMVMVVAKQNVCAVTEALSFNQEGVDCTIYELGHVIDLDPSLKKDVVTILEADAFWDKE